ncbi:MAG: selenocysteine-specific translation elongation factor [Pirellulaceae bacterium]|jgi:selenocysteine-specific elongation factor|nr:selenocysteine-specific translation elongation factor [Pirellulaceae bacterium]
MTTDLILGTAGHIDHGKTSLVRALTGVDTDRLPEEKRRGITIELGFAQLDLGAYRLGIVDVPGHERFVRNMLAGATGLDLAMLVVAADDSVKPQTREHLEILRLLNLEAGVIVITKADLADPDWIELVEDEVRALTAGTFLAGAPLVRTSATTGLGLDTLRAALAAAAERAAQSQRMAMIHAPFRMAIDRSFTIAGHGTVVTGSISSGRVRLGDELVIEPGAVNVRVRGLQHHDRPVDEVHRGQRAAINLAGVHHEAIRRGQELATPGHLVPSRVIAASLSLLGSVGRPLKHRSRVRVHLGTAELLASVALLDRTNLAPGDSAPVQLFLKDGAVATWSQPFVVRSESPLATIGGGRVLDPNAERLRKPDEAVLKLIADLQSPEAACRASAALYFAGLRDWQAGDLVRLAGIENPDEVCRGLVQAGHVREVAVSPTRTRRFHRLVLEQLAARAEAALRKLHARNPLRSRLDRTQLAAAFPYLGEAVFAAVLNDLRQAGRVQISSDSVALTGHGPKLSQNERRLLDELILIFRQAGIQSPSVEECQQRATKSQQSVAQLLALAAANGDLVEIAAGSYLHRDVDSQLQTLLRTHLGDGRGATLSEIREWLATTRKYAVPYCEYLDRIGFTRRDGDRRFLAATTVV